MDWVQISRAGKIDGKRAGESNPISVHTAEGVRRWCEINRQYRKHQREFREENRKQNSDKVVLKTHYYHLYYWDSYKQNCRI